MKLCKHCLRQNFCGNETTQDYCTGYQPIVHTDIITPPFTDGQKQIIEMTEKLAEKRGGKICDVDGIDDDITDIKELLNDTIKRIENPTNEDWFCGLSTEEKAETILEMCKYKPCFACGIGYCDDENWCHVYSDEAKEFVLEWLKEKHSGF